MTLTDLFGSRVLTKMLDFFLENRFWDYTKTEIAYNAGISRKSVYDNWSILEKYEIVTPSRIIGSATLYKTNIGSPVVKALSKLSLAVVVDDNMRQSQINKKGEK